MEEVGNPSIDAPVEKEGACLTAGSCEACAEGAEPVELPIDTTHGRERAKGGGGGVHLPTDMAKNQERTEVPSDRREQNAGRHRAANRYSLSATKHP